MTIHLEYNVELLRCMLNKSIYENIPNTSDCITNRNNVYKACNDIIIYDDKWRYKFNDDLNRWKKIKSWFIIKLCNLLVFIYIQF